MVKASKETLVAAVTRTLAAKVGGGIYLTDENGHDIVTESDYCLTIAEENGEIVVKDVYPGRIYARIKIEVV